MNPFWSKLIKLHVLPLFAALLIFFLGDYLVGKFFISIKVDLHEFAGTATAIRGASSNCEDANDELNLIANLQSDEVITIFGSSELQGLPYSSFYFLPDSAGVPVRAYGHAYQQNLSIACQLLAAGDKLDNAKVCVILSPGWFESEGTNINAFLEFVRPNFLRRIIHDNSIDSNHLLRIASYVNRQFHLINNPSIELSYLKNLHQQKQWLGIGKSLMATYKHKVPKVNYAVRYAPKLEDLHFKEDFDHDKSIKLVQEKFLESAKGNSLFVDSSYFKMYVEANGQHEVTAIRPFTLGEEYEDFFMVVKILKKHNCKASFIFQPLNPYHYSDLQQFDELRNNITQTCASNGFPLLDMFVTSKDEYEPGLLKDIMHPGDLGWMKINQFLLNIYKN